MQPKSVTQSGKTVIAVHSNVSGVKCGGGNGVLGHPQVYYSFDGKTEITCHYCGQVFTRTIG